MANLSDAGVVRNIHSSGYQRQNGGLLFVRLDFDRIDLFPGGHQLH